MTTLARFAIALTSATFGVPADGLAVDAVAARLREWVTSVTGWRRNHRAGV